MSFFWSVNGRVVETPLHLNSGILVSPVVVACKLCPSAVSVVQTLVQVNSVHCFALAMCPFWLVNGRVINTPLHLNSGILV